MIRSTLATVAILVASSLATAQAPPTTPEPVIKIDSPRLRSALYELRLARQSLSESKDIWPVGYRDRALESTQDAIDTVQILLAVKEKDPIVGVERPAEYYKKYADHPRLRAALEDLRAARDELKANPATGEKEKEPGEKEKGRKMDPLREQACDHIDMAVGDILRLIRYQPKK